MFDHDGQPNWKLQRHVGRTDEIFLRLCFGVWVFYINDTKLWLNVIIETRDLYAREKFDNIKTRNLERTQSGKICKLFRIFVAI